MHRIYGFFALIAALTGVWAAPAAAQAPTVFYCYAQDGQTGRVYVSDIHAVGPVAERATYGAEFSRFLSAKGKIASGTQAYCTMQPHAAAAERGAADLVQFCSGCQRPATEVEPIAWPRGGKTVGNLLAGKVVGPGATSAPAGEGSRVQEDVDAAAGMGVTIFGRLDETDIVYTVNEENGTTLARLKADLRGGKWTSIAANDRCAGWFAVAYATNESERQYFLAHGAADEGEASRSALARADSYIKGRDGFWRTGVLLALVNAYRAPDTDLSGGVINAAKGKLRTMVTRECNPQGPASSGVRG